MAIGPAACCGGAPEMLAGQWQETSPPRLIAAAIYHLAETVRLNAGATIVGSDLHPASLATRYRGCAPARARATTSFAFI